ncbi:exodeoxyribonuclease VII large subunit [Vibrio sp. OPT18]|uniref:exodeoxyribonuclease VII large subunit n=1 Tax=Vibrio sp. OPT18 TaxID=2778641 RepID=UPI001D147610
MTSIEPVRSNRGSNSDLSHFTLAELMHLVGVVIRRELDQRYWFTCDIDDLKRNSAGHMYMTLGHKNEGGQKSSVKAIIWNNDIDLANRL